MFPFILTQEAAEEITAPFWITIFDAMKTGFETQVRVRNEYYNHSYMPIRLRSELVRTKALNLLIETYDKQKISNDARIAQDHKNDLIFLVLKERVALRIKKLNNGLKANFNNTKKAKSFIDQQLELDELPHQITKLLLGYRQDGTWTKFNGVYIKSLSQYLFSRHLKWRTKDH